MPFLFLFFNNVSGIGKVKGLGYIHKYIDTTWLVLLRLLVCMLFQG